MAVRHAMRACDVQRLSALARLDTLGARAALREATKDASPDVRMTALLGLSYGDKGRVATQIIRALPDERDPANEQTLMIILARLGTPEATRVFAQRRRAGEGFFKKKPTPTRVAAVAALADASDPTALAAIRAMTKDKEREVRDAAARALPPAKARAAAMIPRSRRPGRSALGKPALDQAKRRRDRSFALSISSSRFRGGAFVCKECTRRSAAAVTSSTA